MIIAGRLVLVYKNRIKKTAMRILPHRCSVVVEVPRVHQGMRRETRWGTIERYIFGRRKGRTRHAIEKDGRGESVCLDGALGDEVPGGAGRAGK